MTARATLSSITLMVAATAIAACGTTDPTPSAGFAAEERPKNERRIVRAPLVEDDAVLEASVAPRKKSTAPRAKKPVTADAASVSEAVEVPQPAPTPAPEPKVVEPDPAPKKDETAALPVGGATGGGTSSGGPGGGQPVVADAPPATGANPGDVATASPPTPTDTLGTAIETPPTVSVEATSPEGGTAPARPGFPWTFSELRDIVNQPVAGFPLWMFIVGGITLLFGLLLATRRRRKPVREEPVVREERRYDDDGEPQPA